MFELPKDDNFREMGEFKIIGTTHGSLQLHIPSKARRAMNLKPTKVGGQVMRCFVNAKAGQIVYELIEPTKKEDRDDRGSRKRV